MDEHPEPCAEEGYALSPQESDGTDDHESKHSKKGIRRTIRFHSCVLM